MKHILIVIWVCLLAMTVLPLLAQDSTPQPPLSGVDVGPVIDSYQESLSGFLSGAVIALNFIIFLVIHALKWALPDQQMKTETIYLFVVGVATLFYGGAALAGLTVQLQAGVDFLNAIAEPLANIILLLIGPAATYRVARLAKVPALGDQQGQAFFSLRRAA